ncbi:hypothetical protein H4R18_001423 [Coemansia javaensis]|uniref:Uncharacterized protein n=1 Tax=Coemansia javaensis TaxID=2761396 RepID=A0A9W8HJR9_9FUNG|nr:hypothetical protein H4R18_001423 [Coemansia javaensis]
MAPADVLAAARAQSLFAGSSAATAESVVDYGGVVAGPGNASERINASLSKLEQLRVSCREALQAGQLGEAAHGQPRGKRVAGTV